MQIPQPNDQVTVDRIGTQRSRTLITQDALLPGVVKARHIGDMYYGNMWLNHEVGNTITVTISSADIYFQVVGAANTFFAGFLNGFIFQNNQELKCIASGKYLVNWSMSVSCAQANQEVMGAVMINTTAQNLTAAHAEVVSANKPQTVSGSGILLLNVNDLVRMAVENQNATNNITVQHVTLTLVKVG